MNIFKMLRSFTATRAPLPAEMQEGQTAINTRLRGMWMKDNTGAIIQIGVMPSDLATVATSGSYNDLTNKPSVSGALQYISPWNASTNNPTIPPASSSNKGNYYVVSVAGSTNIDGNTLWNVGDQLISNGTTWDRVPLSQPIDPTANIACSVDGGIVNAIKYVFTRKCTFPANFTGSMAIVTTYDSLSATIAISKNGTQIGTISYDASAGGISISTTSTSNTVFSVNDNISFSVLSGNVKALAVNVTGQWTLS